MGNLLKLFKLFRGLISFTRLLKEGHYTLVLVSLGLGLALALALHWWQKHRGEHAPLIPEALTRRAAEALTRLTARIPLWGGMMFAGLASLLLIGLGVGLTDEPLVGDSHVHVLATGLADEVGVELQVDGQPVAPSRHIGNHYEFPVPRGKHVVEVRDRASLSSRRFDLDIGFSTTSWLLPAHEDLCAAHFDVSFVAYDVSLFQFLSSNRGGPIFLPVLGRFTETQQPVLVPADSYLTLQEIPATRQDNQVVRLFTTLPCGVVQDDHAAWRALLLLNPGFARRAEALTLTEERPSRAEWSAMSPQQQFEILAKQAGLRSAQPRPSE